MNPMEKTQNFSAFGISLGVHFAILLALAMIQMGLIPTQEEIAIETVIDEERVQEEFTKELETETEISETMNTMSSSMVSTKFGSASSSPAAQVKIDTSESLTDPKIRVRVGKITVPGNTSLGEELGEGQIQGEIGAPVANYGAALSRITQEIIRLMRQQKVLVIWLFDESHSMKDDQAEIAQKFHKVYEELQIVQKKDEQFKKGKEILLTSILSYGEGIHELTSKPTADIDEIRAAIGKIPIDESGKENMCLAIREALKAYRKLAIRQKRKIALVVISDESGDDGLLLEDAINEIKRAQAPVYLLGRESIFGYPYARIKWKDPIYGLNHWLRINRGPETAYPECLQWDGLRSRYDSFSAGFGPYEQVRLAKESGGIFFVLPGEEENLTGPGAHEQRKFDFLDMKPYQPLLLSRPEYASEVIKSDFRKIIWDVIVTFNPNKNEHLPILNSQFDRELNIREIHYSTNMDVFRRQSKISGQRAARAMGKLNVAIPMLEKLKPLRASEASQRWRANFDLTLAQLMSYRIRLFQVLLAIDNHINNPPKLSNPKNNVWNLRRVPKMLVPDDAQFARVKVYFNVTSTREQYLAMLEVRRKEAQDLYAYVMTEHPRTPWSRRAQYELNRGFGMLFYDGFRDPRYAEVGRKIKLPKP